MVMKITYRQANLKDAENISYLILESQREFCFHEYTEEGKKLMLRLCGTRAIESYLDRRDVYFVAIHDSEIIGVAGIRDNEHLSHNFVAADWHRQGISKRLWDLTNGCYHSLLHRSMGRS